MLSTVSRVSKSSGLFRSCIRSFAKGKEPVAVVTMPLHDPLYLKQYHEPKYLELLKPRIPYYDLIDVRVRGYDYPVLESFVKLIQKMCKDLKIKTCDFWGVPATSIRLDSYQNFSELVGNSDVIKVHERTVQIKDLTSRAAAILVEAMMCSKPPGVTVRIGPHRVEDEDVRYIPDLQLEALEKELEDLKNETISVLTQVKKKK